jgi:hypothetical protein
VITPEIYHFSIRGGEPLHQQTEKRGMTLFPFSGFPKLPAIDDISIQDQGVATVFLEETNRLPNMRIANS